MTPAAARPLQSTPNLPAALGVSVGVGLFSVWSSEVLVGSGKIAVSETEKVGIGPAMVVGFSVLRRSAMFSQRYQLDIIFYRVSENFDVHLWLIDIPQVHGEAMSHSFLKQASR